MLGISRVKLVPGEWGALKGNAPLTEEQVEAKALELLAQLSFKEKVHQMSGDTALIRGMIEMAIAYNRKPYPAGENLRLSIPGIRFADGPRGVVPQHSTCFPAAIARGATWDAVLEEQVGDAMGVEARVQGANFFAGICVNILRHPAWGRAQETYGEDPHHLGELSAAIVRGVQRHIMACIKHFAANSVENARFRIDVRMDERTLREIYLPHFKRCIDEGAASVMTAYNKLNGHYCGHNSHLLRSILKGEWGFKGFVISDFLLGVRSGKAARAGLDVEMPLTIHFGRRLRKLVRRGEVPAEVIDEAVLRILRQKVRFAQVGEPERYRPEAVAGPEHRNLAREVARKSMVLLRNERAADGLGPVLPIDTQQVRRLAVIGRLADTPNTGDKGSSYVRPPYVVTPLAGIRAAAPADCEIACGDGRDVARAAEMAARADVAVIVAGYTHRDEGEYMFFKGGDRDVLTLKPHDEDLIQRVAARNPKTVVVLVCGSAVITEAWRGKVPAILLAWYPGMEGGNALADILFGKSNPCAKLPCVFPKSADHLPFFDKRAKSIEYGYFHGYRLFDMEDHEPAFPFGFGLSYTTFSYRNLQLGEVEIGPKGTLDVSVEITNDGELAGEEVVQLYIGYEGSQVKRPKRELKGFRKVLLEPGETKRVQFSLAAAELAYYDEPGAAWVVEPINYVACVGPSSRETDLLRAPFRIGA